MTRLYAIHEKYFESAYRRVCNKVREKNNGQLDVDEVARLFRKRVADFHYHDILMKGSLRLRRDEGLDVSIEEYDAIRKHFLNQKSFSSKWRVARQRESALKGKYRNQLKDPSQNKEKVYEKMRKHGWTKEDIKPYTLPPIAEVKVFLDAYRAKKVPQGVYCTPEDNERSHSTSHDIIYGGRSNPGIDIDLNQASMPEEDDDDDDQFGTAFYDLNLSRHAIDSSHGANWTDEREDENGSYQHHSHQGVYSRSLQ